MISLPPVLDAIAAPFLDPGSRTSVGALLAAGIVGSVVLARRGGPRAAWRGLWGGLWHRSSRLDVQLVLARQLLVALGLFPAVGGLWLATALVRGLDARLGVPEAPAWPAPVVAAVYSLTLFVAWDASRYALHRLMHRVPALWAFHQVHHSAEALTPLTFHRVHPVESLLSQLRGALVTGLVAGLYFWVFRAAAVDVTVLGVHAIGLVLNALSGNLRHSGVWWSWGRWERWWISPAQHQLHHAADPALQQANFGTWLAVWDRLGGSLRLAEAPPARLGLAPAERNHGHDLLSAWTGPFLDVLGATAKRRMLVLPALFLAPKARAEDVDSPSPGDDALIVVTDADGVPQVAGSAHALDEEDLERFAHDDPQQTLTTVPGVYVRGEDGFGLRPNIGIRGASSDRSAKITLLEDGVPLAPAPYAAPAAYYFPMSARLVGIEVFKGPAATQHGPHTIGGTVNLRTRPVPTGPAASISLAAGLRETARAHAWGGTGSERAGVLVEAAHLGTGGFKQLDGGGPTGFSRTDLMLKGRLATDPARATTHAVELKLGLGRERSFETYLGLTPSDAEATPYRRYAASQLGHMEWTRTQAELRWLVRRGHRFELSTVAYHRFLDRAWTKLNAFADGPDLHALLASDPSSGTGAVYLAILRGEEDSAEPGQRLMIGTNDRSFHSAGAQARARWRRGGERAATTVEAGLRVHGDRVVRLHTEDPHEMRDGALIPADAPDLTLLDAETSAIAVAGHLHARVELGAIELSPGLRTEAIHTRLHAAGAAPTKPVTRVTALPGLGLLARAHRDVQLFGGVYRGFSPVAPGQPAEVRPESAINGELGARLGSAGPRLELVGFVSAYDNLLGQCTFAGGCVGDDTDRQYNGGRVDVLGVETLLTDDWPVAPGWTVPYELSWTATEARFKTGFTSGFPQFGAVSAGDRLPYLPAHQGAARVGVARGPASLNLGLTFRGPMLDAAGTFGDGTLEVPALIRLDLAAAIDLGERWRATVNATNLNNTQVTTSWRPYGARPEAPPQVLVGLEWAAGT